MGILSGLTGNGCDGRFDDIVDLIIILIVLQFLCGCVFNNNHHDCC
jgi:hypothetical protein